jgi:hypothetical protein
VRIAILLSKQVPLEGDWQLVVKPYADRIGPNAQACASPGLYTEIDVNTDIEAAVKALFYESVNKLRLAEN